MPPKEVLEAAVEKAETCRVCGGGVRAICENAEAGNVTCDYEILTTLYCRNPKCGWGVSHWRPWKRSQPEAL